MPSREHFLEAFKALAGYEPYEAQKSAVFHDRGPLWILAGPGTGKTEVLVLRTLRLLLLDSVPPEAIVLTTFTEKAARNLHDRLSNYLIGIAKHPAFRSMKKPDLSRLWLGTLHSLAHRVLIDMDEGSEDLELLDESGALFLFLRTLKGSHTWGEEADALYEALLGTAPPKYGGRVVRAGGLFSAVSRIVEDDLDLPRFRVGKPLRGRRDRWPAGTRDAFLALIDGYEKKLGRQVDFARVQKRFLDFLESSAGQHFLAGDPARKLSGIRHVIVDEYQDTNPIQEAIYFALAKTSGNLTVVGDDDQALYRFRGASVDAMVEFKTRCTEALDVRRVEMVRLDENRRSHPVVVKSVNAFIRGVKDTFRFGEARTAKRDLVAKSSVTGSHTPVAILIREDEAVCAAVVASTVAEFQRKGVIEDLRQVALLAPSTRAIGRSRFKDYADAFEVEGVPLFNPRAKDLNKDEHLKAMLGALATILDPKEMYGSDAVMKVRKKYVDALENLDGADELRKWVKHQASEFQLPLAAPGESRFTDRSLLDLFYRILAFEPFRSEVDAKGGPRAALVSWRLAQLTGLISGFEAAQGGINIPRVTDSSRNFFHTMKREVPRGLKGVDCWYAFSFARDLLGAFDSGGFDDAEDEIVSFPSGMVPALTIHQAKGLEFSIVFVCAMQADRGPGASHHQEELFSGYRRHPASGGFSAPERAAHDAIRQHFVAFSRAKYALVLCMDEETYDAATKGGMSSMPYPHLPSGWLRALPRI